MNMQTIPTASNRYEMNLAETLKLMAYQNVTFQDAQLLNKTDKFEWYWENNILKIDALIGHRTLNLCRIG